VLAAAFGDVVMEADQPAVLVDGQALELGPERAAEDGLPTDNVAGERAPAGRSRGGRSQRYPA
jgi:hypothetical protein